MYIEDIYFLGRKSNIFHRVCLIKRSEFSRVRSTSENSDVFNSRDEIYLVFTLKDNISFYFIFFRRFTGGAESAKTNFIFSKPE